MSLQEAVNDYIDAECPLLEGKKGVRNLEELIMLLSPTYQEDRYQSCRTIDLFLQDNPACIEAIINWIAEQDEESWEQNLKEYLRNGEED